MTVLLTCALLGLGPPGAICVRGGEAIPAPRGGHAATLEPIGSLAAWTCIHRREGAWNADTGNGYHGGLQMDRSFMLAYGRDMLRKYGDWAEAWSPRDQMVVAERARASGRGYGPWPQTARACGYL